MPRLDSSLTDTLDQRAQIAAEVEQVLDAHPLAEVLTSMPGVGVRIAARVLVEVADADASTFRTAGHLAKRAEGKKHNAALICLARRSCNVLHAMLRTRTAYQPRRPTAA